MKHLVFFYIKMCWLCQHYLNLSIPGIGRVQQLLKKDFVFQFLKSDKKLYYHKDVVGSYDCLLAGYSNESETHLFFNRIIPHLPECHFIEVGASIGEFVVGVSLYENVKHIYAFEPRKECMFALEETVKLNKDEKRISLFPYIVSEKKGETVFYNNQGGTASGIFSAKSNQSTTINMVTMDEMLPKSLSNAIILVDVEGAEPLVLKGGREFIKNNDPLIIFEYNNVSKKHFNLEDIKNIIGTHYQIYRIKGDASIDQDFDNSWNCVAVPINSNFEKILLINGSK